LHREKEIKDFTKHYLLTNKIYYIMITYRLKQYSNPAKAFESANGKWYARVVSGETIDIEALAEHMANHQSPYTAGTLKGILTDMVDCTKELLLAGNTVSLDDLANFSVAIVNKKGCENKADYKVSEYVEGVKMMVRPIGKLSSSSLNLDATLKRSALDKELDGVTTTTTPGSTGGSGSEDEDDEELKNVLG
jgi:predicted histone-like DNA-binding protein